MGAAISSVFPTPGVAPRDRQAHREHPGGDGQPVREAREARHAGRLHELEVRGRSSPSGPRCGRSSRCPSTLAGEASRGSLDFVAATPFGKRRIALEKLAAHLTMLGARAGDPRARHDGQLERLRRRRARRPDPAAVGGRLRPVGRVHRPVLRRPGVRAGAAPRPVRRGGRRRPRDDRPVGRQRPRRRRTPRGPQPVPLDRRPHRARRRVRLGGAGARRHRGRGLPRDRRRAVHAARPRRHRRSVAARACRRPSSASAARSAGRSATSCRGRCRGGSASGSWARCSRRSSGRWPTRSASSADLLKVFTSIFPDFDLSSAGGFLQLYVAAVLHRGRVRRRDVRLEMGVGRDRRPARDGPRDAARRAPAG